MNKLVFGRYMPGGSLIHRLDPRTRSLASFYFIRVISLTSNWKTHLLLAPSALLSVFLLKVDLKSFIRGIRPLIWLVLFTVVLQVLFTSDGETYWSWGISHITEFGVVSGLFIFCRFMLIIFISTLFMLTTPPSELSDVIECLLRPLKAIRFPVHEISSILSTVLRSVSTLMDETEKIMNAQRTHGVDFGEGSLVRKMKIVIPLLILLSVSSFNRAEDLAIVMEARGYKGGEGRTKYHVLHWHNRNTVVIITFVLLIVLLIFLRG